MRAREPTVVVIAEGDEAMPIALPRRRPVIRWSSRAAGIAATVLLHLVVSAPLILGVGAQKKRQPTPDGIGSAAWASKGEQAESMILMDLSAMSMSAEEEMAPLAPIEDTIAPVDMRLLIAGQEPTLPRDAMTEDDAAHDEETTEAAGDPAGKAEVFGRYMGHVAARINRVWMRPRTAIVGGRFECRARIARDRRGNVESIELQGCTSDDRWRQSLTSAILRASPLSAPPEPWLYTETITLSFSAEQYVPDQTPEYEYEPAISRVAANRPLDDSFIGRDPSTLTHEALDSDGDVELTNRGGTLRWEKKNKSAATPH